MQESIDIWEHDLKLTVHDTIKKYKYTQSTSLGIHLVCIVTISQTSSILQIIFTFVTMMGSAYPLNIGLQHLIVSHWLVPQVPDNNNADAKIYLQSKAADRWGDKVRSGHLPKKRSVVVYEYNHYVRSSMTLPALTFTEKECNNVLFPDFNQELLSSFLRIPSTELKVTDASVYMI